MSSFKNGWVQRQLNRGIRPKQMLTFITAIVYCLAVFYDAVILKLPPVFFALLTLMIGGSYVICSFGSRYKVWYIVLGTIWGAMGIGMAVLGYRIKLMGIPMAVIISSLGYVIAMGMLALIIARRRKDYINPASYLFCLSYMVIMAVAHALYFFGIVIYTAPQSYPELLRGFGNAVVAVSGYSFLQVMSMIGIALSLFLQMPLTLTIKSSGRRLRA